MRKFSLLLKKSETHDQKTPNTYEAENHQSISKWSRYLQGLITSHETFHFARHQRKVLHSISIGRNGGYWHIYHVKTPGFIETIQTHRWDKRAKHGLLSTDHPLFIWFYQLCPKNHGLPGWMSGSTMHSKRDKINRWPSTGTKRICWILK